MPFKEDNPFQISPKQQEAETREIKKMIDAAAKVESIEDYETASFFELVQCSRLGDEKAFEEICNRGNWQLDNPTMVRRYKSN